MFWFHKMRFLPKRILLINFFPAFRGGSLVLFLHCECTISIPLFVFTSGPSGWLTEGRGVESGGLSRGEGIVEKIDDEP